MGIGPDDRDIHWRPDNPELNQDYDLVRWTTGETDESGHLVWHDRYPNNDEWVDIRLVTVDLEPEKQTEIDGDISYGNPVNLPILPERPLDPYGTYDPDTSEFYYDLDDLVGDAFERYGLDF